MSTKKRNRQGNDGVPQVKVNELTVGATLPVNVILRVQPSTVKEIPWANLVPNALNDRILDKIEENGGPPKAHETDWYQDVFMEDEEGKKLYDAIRTAGGHTVPIYVQRIRNRPGFWTVWEGNRRWAVYGVLNKSENESERAKFAKMTCIELPDDTTREEWDYFIGSIGHGTIRHEGGGAGMKGWSPSSNARYLSRLHNEYRRSAEWIAEFLGLSKTLVKQKLRAYDRLRKLKADEKDKPAKDRLTNPDKLLPSFEELERKPKLRKIVDEGREADFVSIMAGQVESDNGKKAEKVTDKTRGVRDIAKLVQHAGKDVLEDLKKPDATLKTVTEKVTKKHPEMKHKSFASILNSALKAVRECKVRDLVAVKNDEQMNKLYVDLHKELVAKAKQGDIDLS